MRLDKFGDTYDVVKQSLLRWLGNLGPWAAHPMFTEAVSGPEAKAFAGLLGVPLLSSEVLGANTDRIAYFTPARACASHLFLDPDTGLTLKKMEVSRIPAYLLGEELVSIVQARPEWLTLVFDQSVARGRERQQLEEKLAALAAHHVHGWAYMSHACFLLLGCDGPTVKRAVQVVQAQSRLPASRFVYGGAVEQGDEADEA